MNEQDPKQAVIYCRVSHPRQKKEGNGLASQEGRCREFAGYMIMMSLPCMARTLPTRPRTAKVWARC